MPLTVVRSAPLVQVGLVQIRIDGQIHPWETNLRQVGAILAVAAERGHDADGGEDVGRHAHRGAGHHEFAGDGRALHRQRLRRAEVMVANVRGKDIADRAPVFG
jgi:hypothetical protein